MIYSFAITNYLGDRVKLELGKPEVSGFLIKSVTGLGPVKANVNTTEVVTNDGSMFNSARLSQRNIVFQLAFVDTVTGRPSRISDRSPTNISLQKRALRL